MRFCRIKRDKEAYFEITDAFCMVSFSKLLVCTTDCRNHSPAPLLPRPGRQCRMRQRIHPGLQSLTTNSRDAAKRRAERRGRSGARSSLPAPRPRHRQQHPQSETPRTARASAASAVLLVREKTPETPRVNLSSSQAPVHIGEHRHNLLRTTRPRHRFDLQPQVRWICQKKPRKGVMSTQCT